MPDEIEAITMRDLFAAAALAGLMAHHDYGQNPPEWIAREAWIQADAMLAARAAESGISERGE